MYVSNRTESSEHLPPREHESAAGENAAPITLFDSDVMGWRKRRNVFGGGRNQQKGTECFDGWGGSAGKEVLLIQRRGESDVAKK